MNSFILELAFETRSLQQVYLQQQLNSEYLALLTSGKFRSNYLKHSTFFVLDIFQSHTENIIIFLFKICFNTFETWIR